ncbi:hypothetical protein [Oceanobacillus kapialis]|uniref:hypothetical protein n=1 Tax=Oceanobacillus kapialis TaxID=481353 RepID=UPI00384E7B0B
MINLFKMDFRRFIRNKVMYSLLLIYSAFQIFGVFMMSVYEEPMAESGVQTSQMNASEFIQSVLSQTPSWMLLYIMVFTIYFYMSELNAGFYKNYITMKHARINSVLSKIIIQAFFILLMLLTLIISDLIGRSIFFGNNAIGDIGFFMKLISSQFLLQWAFSVLILCVAIITKKMLGSLIIGLALALNLVGMILSSLETVLFDKTYVSDYLLVNTIMRIKDFHDLNEWITVLSTGLVFLVMFIGIAARYKWREDLR